MIKNIVLSSGVMRGYSYVGVLKSLTKNNLLNDYENILGCSIGSIFSLLFVLRYTAEELEAIIPKIDTDIFRDIDYNKIIEFPSTYGVCDINKIIKIIEILIKAKTKNKDITFKELYGITNKNLIIVSTCLNKCKSVYFNYRDYPDFKVSEAIKMSISVPYLFPPVKYNDCLFVDGAILDTFPINYFKDDINNTIGIVLNKDVNFFDINTLEDYFKVLCFSSNYNKLNDLLEKYSKNCILIECNTECFNFNLSMEEKLKLIDCGYKSTEKYIESDNFKELFCKDKENNENNENKEKISKESIKTNESNKEKISKESNDS